MQVTFRNQWQFANYVRSCIKKELKHQRPIVPARPVIPVLDRSNYYYFCFELYPNDEYNKMYWGLVCFDQYRNHYFSDKGEMPVSLWRFRRQGIKFTASYIQDTIVSAFRKKWWPIKKDDPFIRVSDGLYMVNLNWVLYQDYLKL